MAAAAAAVRGTGRAIGLGGERVTALVWRVRNSQTKSGGSYAATGSGVRSLDKLGMTNKNAPFCGHSERSESLSRALPREISDHARLNQHSAARAAHRSSELSNELLTQDTSVLF